VTESSVPPEIHRLSKKMTDEPASKVFVQLADEYLKYGLLKEALWILSEGIRNHPNYVAARMMRGKVYLQTRQTKEAKDDFEAVIREHPENILAHKKLALIYRELGRLGETVRICNLILKIDPKDRETDLLLASVQEEISAMDDIQSLSSPPSAVNLGEVIMWSGMDTFSVSEEMKSEAVISDEVPVLEDVVQVGCDDRAHPAAPEPVNLVRLKAWLGSIQEKKRYR
jgi:tetratricopeptide (TPR) repeat protein